jgi:hypothetical protein
VELVPLDPARPAVPLDPATTLAPPEAELDEEELIEELPPAAVLAEPVAPPPTEEELSAPAPPLLLEPPPLSDEQAKPTIINTVDRAQTCFLEFMVSFLDAHRSGLAPATLLPVECGKDQER